MRKANESSRANLARRINGLSETMGMNFRLDSRGDEIELLSESAAGKLVKVIRDMETITRYGADFGHVFSNTYPAMNLDNAIRCLYKAAHEFADQPALQLQYVNYAEAGLISTNTDSGKESTVRKFTDGSGNIVLVSYHFQWDSGSTLCADARVTDGPQKGKHATYSTYEMGQFKSLDAFNEKISDDLHLSYEIEKNGETIAKQPHAVDILSAASPHAPATLDKLDRLTLALNAFAANEGSLDGASVNRSSVQAAWISLSTPR